MTGKKELVTAVVQYRSPANEKQESRLRLDFLMSYLLTYRASCFRRAEMKRTLTLGPKRCSLL